MDEVALHLIGKLALAMNGYMNDPVLDVDSPFLVLSENTDGSSIVRLTKEENDLLQRVMRMSNVTYSDTIH